MRYLAVMAVVVGVLAVGYGLGAAVAAVLRARARRLGLKPRDGLPTSDGSANQPDDWVYLPWSNVAPHHFGQGHHHGGPGQAPSGGDTQPGHHHGDHGGHGGGDLGGGHHSG